MLYNILYYNESRCYLTELFGDVLRCDKYSDKIYIILMYIMLNTYRK